MIILDNASKDDSVSYVKAHFPHFRIIVNPKNEGTALGTNLGVPQARGELLLLLSNDMEFDPHLIEQMVATMDSDPTIGIVGCKMMRLTADNQHTNIIDNIGGDCDIFGFPYVHGQNETDRGQWTAEADVFFAFGGGILIRKRLFEELQGFDPAFFTLVDDIDISWRCRLLGYRVVVNPQAVLYHKVSATLKTKLNRQHRRYIAERNTCRMLLKNYRDINLVWVMPFYFSILLIEVLFFTLTFRLEMASAGLKAIVWNIRHLNDTLMKRHYIQSQRRCGDRAIMRHMRCSSAKIAIGIESIRADICRFLSRLS